MAQTNFGRPITAAVVLFCVSLALTAYTAHDSRIVKYGATFFSEILAPVQSLNRSVHDSISSIWEHYVNLIGVKKDYEHLVERFILVEAENSRLIELASENERLKGLLKVSAENKLTGPVAKVLAYDPTNWSKRITIDLGSNDGIKEGLAVVSGNGVVGQVVSVGLHTAQVLLLSDPGSGADALIQRSRARGVIEGTGSSACRLQYIGSEEDVAEGDRVVTSGLDGIYPKGLLLGVVTFVADYEKGMQFRRVKVTTLVDFSKLEDVMVVTGVQEAEDKEE